MKNNIRIRIGTRRSRLARLQAEWVASQLRDLDLNVELVTITTQGDQQVSGPIGSLGSTGIFTKEIQRAVLEGRVDLAVHSLKDLPTVSLDGLCLAAVPRRSACEDVLISAGNRTLLELAPQSRLGTGSIRRRSQILHLREDLAVLDIRGNVETRIDKLQKGQYDAIMLARAGLSRMGLDHHISQTFSTNEIMPAVGQGALGLETRTDDFSVRECLRALDHAPTHHAVLAERALLAHLRGGCLAPVGAWGRVDDEQRLYLDAVVLNPQGTQRLGCSQQGPAEEAEKIGQQGANELLRQGAASLLDAARDSGGR
jgi:hydroxymethylbilane synthase